MEPRYAVWIESFVSSHAQRFIRGKCQEAVTKMVATFPELRKAAGFVYTLNWGREQHWWCVTPGGEIVDPTAEQYLAAFVTHYEELDLNDPEARRRVPTGRCMDCGEDVYEGKTFCNESCEAATRSYLGI